MLFSYTPLSPCIGAEVEGFDPSYLDNAEARQELKAAFLKYHLLKINIPNFSSEDQVKFSEIFGEITIRGNYQVDPEEPKTQYISNTRGDGILGRGELAFHHDHLFYEHPLTALVLYGIEVPESGSVTRFRSESCLLDKLPADIRSKCEGIECLHLYDYYNPAILAGILTKDMSGDLSKVTPGSPQQWRPLIWKEPRSGKDLLLLSPIADIAGNIESKGAAREFHTELMAMGEEAGFVDAITYDHHWEQNDLVIWDNLVLAHARTPFKSEEPRTLRRTPIV